MKPIMVAPERAPQITVFMTSSNRLTRAGRRLRRLRARMRRMRNVALWGAPGLVHALFDAPRPQVRRSVDSLPVDASLVARIVKCYQRSREAQADFVSWSHIAPLQTALEAGDCDTVAAHFSDLFRGSLVLGMGHAEALYFGERKWRAGYNELRMTDMLLCLGEALGVVTLPNHAQMKIDEYVAVLHTDQDALFADIERALGFSLEMPLVGYPPVFVFGGVTTSADMVRHAYVAARIRQITSATSGRVLELGAGFGSLALLARRAGCVEYTIIDLPQVNAIQMFFLGTALGPDAVSGYGETPRRLRILPPVAIREIADGSIDLIVNMDSLPEIDRGEALSYLREFRRVGRSFLSINQEARAKHTRGEQTVVQELTREVGGFERIQRFPYWMIEGYVEELYRTTP